jgi:hypothetical protein
MPSIFKKLLKRKAPPTQKCVVDEPSPETASPSLDRNLPFQTSGFTFTFRATCTAEVSSDEDAFLDTTASGKWHALTWEALSTGAHWPSRVKQKRSSRGRELAKDYGDIPARVVPVPTVFFPTDTSNDIDSSVNPDISTRKNSPFRFMDLPPEIRYEVYCLLLSPGNKVKPYTITWLKDQSAIPRADLQSPALHPNVLRLSKRVYLEAVAILYEKNTFEFSHTPAPFINPVMRPFDGQFTPWTNIRNLIIRHIKPRHAGMSHTKNDWIITLDTRFRIREMPHLQTIWLEFPVSADWASSPQQIIRPIVDALEATNTELVPPFNSKRLEKLNVVSVAWIQGHHSQFRWTPSTVENKGTVCVGLVTGNRKMPSHFYPMKSFDPKVWDAQWGEFRSLKVPWIFKRDSAIEKK